MPRTLKRFLFIISFRVLKRSVSFLIRQNRLLIAWRDMLIDSIVTHPLFCSPPGAVQSPILPPELWHLIFGNFCNPSTLRACSLVCRAWASFSRDHLRLEMALHPRERTVQLCHLLRSRVQTLARSVYRVRGNGYDVAQYRRVMRLLRLRGANIRSAVIQVPPGVRTMPLLAQYFPDVVDLSFELATFSAFSAFSDLAAVYLFLLQLCQFRNLRSVSLTVYIEMDMRNVKWRDGRSPFERRDTHLPFTRLCIRGKWSGSFLRLVQRFCGPLETLELLGMDGWESDIRDTESMLLANAETLRHLQLTVPAAYLDAPPLNLSVVNDLRSLLLELSDDSRACFDCAVRTLQSLDPLRPPREVCVQASIRKGLYALRHLEIHVTQTSNFKLQKAPKASKSSKNILKLMYHSHET
ncbi:hypothetical protein BDZ89DRAFT_1134320 [Hymenopellis radicata]|nr:hypothetical protein BDZ89DRAFT_1134320 [Hymenopellis radicata]